MQQAAAGAAHVGAQTGAGAQQVGAAGAQQVGAGAQQLGLQQRVLQHFGLQHRVLQHLGLQQLNLGMWKLQRFLQQLLLPQQEAAGAAHVGAQTGAGAAHVGAGAQQLGAGAQQLLVRQLPQLPNQPAFASVALAQQNSKAAINVVHFIIVISWNGVF